jgi:hypothetical protein
MEEGTEVWTHLPKVTQLVRVESLWYDVQAGRGSPLLHNITPTKQSEIPPM